MGTQRAVKQPDEALKVFRRGRATVEGVEDRDRTAGSASGAFREEDALLTM